ncbi:MAG: epoxide hydrolase [Gammaproteobacteria bacterium]|nr:epoxide hydrolase [Gammaproteobacteria bacterium]MBQ0838935.1 epoxide hydrolase [Gammaproteobacteria bacterium]
MSNDSIRAFQIAVSDEVLADLKQRLANTRWPEKETVDDWSQGIPLAYTQEVCEYWLNDYDWRSREALLNQYDQFITELEGVDIHFIHARSAHANARPLLMTHGWPGSIVEFQKVIGPLIDPEAHGGDAADAFHVVCPTLPGYGFSGKPSDHGWNIEKIAATWNKLMLRLGYDCYFAQGGDWGAAVTAAIGMQNLGNCQGIHLNMVIVEPDPATMDDLTPLEQSALAGMQYYADHDSGYSKQQSTRPQTVGYGLSDSPVGQMAWILEKYWAWMDCDGHPENVLSKDELLDNIMLYWCTASAASSARLYWESFNDLSRDEVVLATGCSVYPKEIFRASRRWAERRFKNLIHWNELDKGGHFSAFEVPETFIKEVRNCFRSLR